MHALSYSEGVIRAVAGLLEKVYLVKLPGISWQREGIPYYDDVYNYLEAKYTDSIKLLNDRYGIELAVLGEREKVIPISAGAEKIYDELCQQILENVSTILRESSQQRDM